MVIVLSLVHFVLLLLRTTPDKLLVPLSVRVSVCCTVPTGAVLSCTLPPNINTTISLQKYSNPLAVKNRQES